MAGTLPFRPDLVVLNLAELMMIHVADWHTGANAWVVAQSDYYVLDKNSSALISGSDIVAPIAGSPIAGAPAAKWIRGSLAIAPGASTQAAWFIDSVNGINTNDGSAATQGAGSIGPIQTLTEWARRVIAAGGVKTAMVVNILANTLATDEARGTINIFQSLGGLLQFKGTLGVTNIRNGTLTPVTTCVPATNTPWAGTDSVGAVWTSAISNSATTGKRVRNTTVGANLNSTFWPAKDLTLGACRFSQPIAAPVLTNGVFATSMSSIVNNDTYALEQLPIIQAPWGLEFNGTSSVVSQETLQFVDLAFQNTTFSTLVANSFGWLAFYNCDLGSLTVAAANYYFVNCRGATGGGGGYFQNFQTDVNVFAGLYMKGFAVEGAGIFDFRMLCQGGGLDVSTNDGALTLIASVQTFDSSRGGIIFDDGSRGSIEAIFGAREIFGSGNTGFGIRVLGGALPTYKTNTTGMTITGTTNDVGIGSTAVAKAYGGLPFIDSDIAAGSGTKFAGLILL